MKVLIALLAVLVLVSCSETENITDADLGISYSVMAADVQEQIVGGWILSSFPSHNDFDVFIELDWLRDIENLEVAEYVISAWFYPNGRWHIVLASSFVGEPIIYDTAYLVGEYILTDTEFMISGGRYGCFNVDSGTYTISETTLSLKNGYSTLYFERIGADEPEDEPEQIRLWD